MQKRDFQKRMMGDLVTKEDALPEEAIVDWMRMYEEQEPHSEEIRQIHRFNRNVTKEDTELLEMSTLLVRAGINAASSVPLAQVIIVGRCKHLKKISFENSFAEKLKVVGKDLFEKAQEALPSCGSLPFYLNLAKFITVPDKTSRGNTPSHCHSITRELRSTQVASGVKNLSVVVYSDYANVVASVAAVARAFPIYSRKTGNCAAKLDNIDIEVIVADDKPLENADVKFLQSLCDSIRECGRQIDAPCNEFNSEVFADKASKMVDQLGVPIEKTIIKGEELREKGFGGIYHVGKAALFPPVFACFSYKPAGSTHTYALVGKGIVYDTGGMQIKGKTTMPNMKRDMGGAAGVLAAFCTLVQSGFKENLHCLLCIAENNISPVANKPDDIITMLSGKTVEINNTDAEGRLVLADGVYYAKNVLNAQTIIDMATLTGAQSYATGKLHGAILTNSDEWEQKAVVAGRASGDLVHPLPYAPDLHGGDLKSPVADMRNSNLGKMEGPPSAVAGLFISAHIDHSSEVDWLHFDIASPAESADRGTGYGPALLSKLLGSHTEVPLLKSM
ncbi:hypothetical protein QR680_017602 [Steinernema hermaphroditum]|uniref:Cytosol aminopeptidase domain-containing protein n=1 Tax=Steinernema hermaphroditum TaxID=289476 RepID=A0AA39HF64_9BILA|nr:hypothetical protein QR680_017602 [Steinernema hermaphroditum]